MITARCESTKLLRSAPIGEDKALGQAGGQGSTGTKVTVEDAVLELDTSSSVDARWHWENLSPGATAMAMMAVAKPTQLSYQLQACHSVLLRPDSVDGRTDMFSFNM